MNENNKIEAIDALRGWAILAVLINHTNVISPAAKIFSILFEQGGRGVQLFFIISSYTLFLSWSNRKSSEISPVRNYLIRRFFRIAPMFYLALCFWLVYEGLGPNQYAPHGVGFLTIVSTFFFVNGFHVETLQAIFPGGWTIAIEMNYYILLIYLFARVRDLNDSIKYGFIISLIGLVISIFGFYQSHNYYEGNLLAVAHGYFGNFWLPIQLPSFMAGIVLYYLIKAGFKVDRIILLLISLIGVAVLPFTDLPLMLVFYTPFLFLFSYALILDDSNKKRIIPSKYFLNLFNNPVIRQLGILSYSIYITHFVVIQYLTNTLSKSVIKNFFFTFLLVLMITTLISYCTHYFIEKPAQNLGKKIIQYLESKNE